MTDAPRPDPREAPRLVFVTGASGAGRLTAINALADLGFEAIDNLPLALLDRLLAGGPLERPMALGIDTRNRDFTADGLVETVDRLDQSEALRVDLLFLDCRSDVLLRRYSETRRRHPMAPAENPGIGIEREIELLTPVRARADILVDTSDLSPHDLRAELTRLFEGGKEAALAVSLQSFSYKRGLPRGTTSCSTSGSSPTPTGRPTSARSTGATRGWGLRCVRRTLRRVPRKGQRTGALAPSGLHRRGKDLSDDRLWLHRRPAPVRRGGRAARRGAGGRGMAGVRAAPGTGAARSRRSGSW